MRQSDRRHHASGLLAALAVVVATVAAGSGRAASIGDLPLAGIVRSGGAPVAGVELLVHGLSAPIATFSRIVRTAADGTWVLPAAPAGFYAVSSLAAAFRPAVARVWHRAEAGNVSFVALELERPGGILPKSSLGDADPWIARAITSGDVLRERDPVAVDPAPLGGPAQAPGSHVAAADLRLPLRASVASTTGFGASDGANLSGTSVDLAGNLGPSVRFGLEGQYRRIGAGEDGGLGSASRLTLDVAPGVQAIRLSARRQSLAGDGDDPARFAAQAIDWTAQTGDLSRASVSARLMSESNLLQHGPVASLFGRASNAFEVEARYLTESHDGNFVRFAVGYRSATGGDLPATALVAFDRETRVGGTAGIQLSRVLSVETGAMGDVSSLVKGVAPELTIAVRTGNGIRIYGFVSRRFEDRVEGAIPLPRAGTDDAGLSRLSRSLYKAGVRWDGEQGDSVSLEASQREVVGTYRLLLDPEFFDNLDSLYFLDGDVAREIGASTTFRVSQGLQARLSARGGRIEGNRLAAIARDEATWSLVEAALRVGATRTSVGVGYRVVAQEFDTTNAAVRNDLNALDFTLAQALPLPLLRALGTEWRALFSLEVGRRQEGLQEARLHRRFSGGLALNF